MHRTRTTLAIRAAAAGLAISAAWLVLQAAPADGPAKDLGESPAIREHVDQAKIDAGEIALPELMRLGADLFSVKANLFDGRGRPAATGHPKPTKRVFQKSPDFMRTSGPDANSCAGCHNEPRAGGSGDFVSNVFVLSQTLDPVVDSVAAEFSNERNTLGMNGAGAIELLAREMTTDLQTIRERSIREARASGAAVSLDLVAKGVWFGTITARPDGTVVTGGVRGVNPDLVVRPFHQKGVVVSLREFTVNAFNHHHGLEAVERFGTARTGMSDFDEDGVEDELTVGDITAAAIFQATLNMPGRVIPEDAAASAAIARGEARFAEIGCTSCHVSALPLRSTVFTEPNPNNPEGYLRPVDVTRPFSFDLTREGEAPRLERLPDGTALVRAYTDLKRHDLCDADLRHYCNERVVQLGVRTELFLTRKLWDAGSSAPYGHRGDLSSLTEAIYWHGGEARASRDAFVKLPRAQRDEIVEFLKSLRVLPPGSRPRLASLPEPGLR